MVKYYIYIIVFVFAVLFGSAVQGQISVGEDKEICFGETVWLKAEVTDSYATQIMLEDDTVVGPIPIGFDFEFYGITYDEFYISSNGWISFSAPFPYNDSWNGGHSPRELPDDADFVPKNCIMGAWQDWSPAFSGGVGYEIKGTAPNRSMTVSFCQVSAYNCEDLTGTFQIVLRETENYIDINLNSKPFCPDWYEGKAVLGVQNLDATDAVVAPGRNATQWLANQESWRFIPSATSYSLQILSSYIPVLSGTLGPIEWYLDDVDPGNYLGTSDSIPVSPSTTSEYIAAVTLCGDLQFRDTVEVVVYPVPTADAGEDQTIIVATNTTLDGSGSDCPNGGCQYSWSPASMISDDPTLEQPTTVNLSYTTAYYLSLEDQYGCKSDSNRVVINVINGPLSLLLTADPLNICRGDEVELTAIGGGGQRPYTYEWWSDPPGATFQDSAITVYPDVTTKYFCKMTDFDGDSEELEITVSVMNPEPDIDGKAIVCENEYDVSYFSSGHGNNSYFWNIEGGSIEGSNIDTSVSVSWNGSGIGKVILTETLPPPLGCVSYDTLEVQVLNRPVPDITGPETVCENEEGVIYLTSESQDRIYSWLVEGGVSTAPGSATTSVDWGSAGQGKVSLTEKLEILPACKSSRTLDVTILPGPQPVITGSTIACEQDHQVVYITPSVSGVNSSWQVNGNGQITGNTTDDQVYVDWLNPGVGELLLTQEIESSGCRAVADTFKVTVNPMPEVIVSPETVDICQGIDVELSASGAESYRWFPEQGLSAINEPVVTFTASETIDYYVVGLNEYSCRDTVWVHADVTPMPVLDLGGDRYIRENEPVTLFAGEGNDYYEWQDGSGGNEFVAEEGGLYYVYVEKNGCFNTDTVFISPTMGAIPIPTAFSPNGDGLNDEFRIFGQLDKVQHFLMHIYTRSGQLVYSSSNVYKGWDGRDQQGNDLPCGTYVYSIDIYEQGNPFDQGMIRRNGTITLLR